MTEKAKALLALCACMLMSAAAVEPERSARFAVDASAPGKTLWNTACTEVNWCHATAPYAKMKRCSNPAWDVGAFVTRMELMQATGGNPERDLFRDPANRAVLDDYDFAPLVASCRGLLRLGVKPYLKLGSVPQKYSPVYTNRPTFCTNVYPPSDWEVYWKYLHACASALKEAFGVAELESWQFGVMTEYENRDWFMTPSDSSEETFGAYCRLYDYTVDAFTSAISTNLFFGAHSMSVTRGFWDERRFIRHCAQGVNRRTGRRGSKLDFLTVSFYDVTPSQFSAARDLPETIARVRDAARAFGLDHLRYGVDEGRILNGVKGATSAALISRIAGQTFQAAYDARLVRQMYDADIDYFAAWGYSGHGPDFSDDILPTLSFFVAREGAKFAGLRRLPVVSGARVGLSGASLRTGGVEVDAVAALSPDGRRLRVMAYNFQMNPSYRDAVRVRLDVAAPAWRGRAAAVARTDVDDACNWFNDWIVDRAKLGLAAQDFNWSPDSVTITGNQRTPKAFAARAEIVKTLLPRYRAKAEPRRVESVASVGADGVLVLEAPLGANGVAFWDVAVRD